MRFATCARSIGPMLPFLLVAFLHAQSVAAGAIYPIDRAQILSGSRFDLKVEFDRAVAPGDVRVTLNGTDLAAATGKTPQFVANDEGANASAIVLRDLQLERPGRYVVEASAAGESLRVEWEVYGTGPRAFSRRA